MASYTINKGLDIRLAGAPEPVVVELPPPQDATVIPQEFPGLKHRLLVREGDRVKRGTPLVYAKNLEGFRICSPVEGVVRHIVYGPRRLMERIVIAAEGLKACEPFPRHDTARILSLSREEVLQQLLASGLLAAIHQRPFSRMASPSAEPKSIFVNAMNTAPFQPDINVAVKGSEAAFQAGLNALTRLTKGDVHLCLDGRLNNTEAVTNAANVKVNSFRGPHPAGNTSVHISRIDPIRPHDVVWTVHATEVLLIGHLFLTGEYPSPRTISLGGPGVKPGARRYYRTLVGAPLRSLLDGRLESGEQRIVDGDVFTGAAAPADGCVKFHTRGLTVLPEDRERHLLSWMLPGFSAFSASRAFASTWFARGREWALGTNQHGEPRPMVLTGLYDRYLPMNILVDYLVRAVLANDTDEAIKLGILETAPEDFAVCAFACPSKMDLCGIVRRGLADIEKEGI